ncbi:MAG: ABC transporter permease [Bacteroidota bacterium]
MGVSSFISSRLLRSRSESAKSETTLTGVSMIAIALGMAVMTISIIVVTGFKREIESKIRGFGADIRIAEFGSDNPYDEQPIDAEAIKQKLSQVEGIKNIQSYATKAGIIKTEKEIQGVLLKGIDENYDLSFIEKHLVSGKLPTRNDSISTKEVVISSGLSSMMRIKTGDTITVYFIEDPPRVRKIRVSGVYNTGLGEFDRLYGFCDIGLIRKLNNWDQTKSGGLEIVMNEGENADRMTEKIGAKIGFQYQATSIHQQYPQIFQWLELQNVNVFIIITLILAVSGVSMVSTLLIIILNRTRMIGLLKAIGASDRVIQNVFIRLSLPIIIKGLILGNMIGLGLCWLQYQFGIITLPEESYYVSQVPVHFSLVDLSLLNLGTLVICVLMLIGPSMIISGIRPSKTLRFD